MYQRFVATRTVEHAAVLAQAKFSTAPSFAARTATNCTTFIPKIQRNFLAKALKSRDNALTSNDIPWPIFIILGSDIIDFNVEVTSFHTSGIILGSNRRDQAIKANLLQEKNKKTAKIPRIKYREESGDTSHSLKTKGTLHIT